MASITNQQLDTLGQLGGDIGALVAEVRAFRSNVCRPTIPPQSPLRVGNNVLIRTVTHYYTGRVEVLTESEIVLSSAAWIVDTGRFSTALSTGKLGETEPFPGAGVVSIGRGALVDAADWAFELPRSQK
jgi:hypothetical protein